MYVYVCIYMYCVLLDPNHGEALNNVAVLELRRQKFDLARSCLTSSMDVGPFLFEPLFNSGTPLSPSYHVVMFVYCYCYWSMVIYISIYIESLIDCLIV